MNRSVGSQLISLSTLVVAGALLSLVLAVCIFAFNASVVGLNRDGDTLLDEARTALSRDPASSDARTAAQAIAPRLFRRALIIVFVDDAHRVTVFFRRGDPAHAKPQIGVRDRGDRSAEPIARGVLARVILGSAAISGLTTNRSHFGSVDVYVKDNDAIFVAGIERYLPFLALALVAIVALAIVSGNIVNRQALRPLVRVTNALERLAVGDLKSEFVLTSSRGQLGRLATAYNRAAAQVESALWERDQANASIRQFIADAGHQLRTPLTVIRGFIAILDESETENSPERRHILDVMRQQSWLIGSLIENLILLDQWELGANATTAIVDVTQLVEDIVGALADVNPQRALSVEQPVPGTLLATIDPRELTYAMTNLVDNALKYTSGAIRVTFAANEAALTIAVEDDGPGMADTVAEHAFDRFFRGDRRDVEGSGLGLAIARRAIERGGGDVKLATSRAHGTRVTITLPRA